MAKRFDIAIGGAGLTGAVLAIALVRSVKPDLSVALVGPEPRADDPRAYAIAPGVCRMLETLGLWKHMAADACPVEEMIVGDSRLEDVVRPSLLALRNEVIAGEPVAHIVPASALTRAAAAVLKDLPIERIDIGLFHDLETSAGVSTLHGQSGSVEAGLIVAADGARSTIRESAGIKSIGWSYDQSGVVATLASELPHSNTAYQHFLPSGPFALLPLPYNHFSLVCSMPTEDANRLAAMDAEAFSREIEYRAGAAIGPLNAVTPAFAFPLGLAIAREFVRPRLALAGDAAHRMHPLAGQGQNMGLRDVAALAETLIDAARLGEDLGSLAVLERYQRWRRFDTVQLAAVTDGLNRLFSNDSNILRALRDTGLGIVDRVSSLKSTMLRDAAGNVGAVPRLLAGQPL